jgi:hypothetical protein
MLVATVLVTVNSVRRLRAGRTRELAADAMIAKLVSIPFFLLNFAALVFVAYAGIGLMFPVRPSLLWSRSASS